jgi:hypothetical protein
VLGVADACPRAKSKFHCPRSNNINSRPHTHTQSPSRDSPWPHLATGDRAHTRTHTSTHSLTTQTHGNNKHHPMHRHTSTLKRSCVWLRRRSLVMQCLQLTARKQTDLRCSTCKQRTAGFGGRSATPGARCVLAYIRMCFLVCTYC